MKRFFLTASILALGVTAMNGAQAHDLRQDVVSQNSIVMVSTDSAKSFIVNMSGDAIGFLGNAELTQAKKQEEFKKLLRSSFDMGTIGRFALGQYWNSASAEQRKEYQKLFEAMVVRVYSARFSEYKGQTLDVTAARQDGKDVLVTSYIVPPSGSKIRVDWRVRHKDGKNKIVDVIIEGVSMAMTQRADFSSVIQRGGGNIQVLIDHLKKG